MMKLLREFYRYCWLLVFRRPPNPPFIVKVESHERSQEGSQQRSPQDQPTAPIEQSQPAPARQPDPAAPAAPAPVIAATPTPLKRDPVPMLAMDIIPPPVAPPRRYHGEPRERDKWLPRPERPRRKASDPAKSRKLKVVKSDEASTAVVADPTDPENPWDFRREGVEEAGTFYFRGVLLDNLPKYFRSLRRLRGADPDVYHLCATTGMSLLPARMIGLLRELPAWWHDPETRPAFGAASFAEHVDEDNVLRLVYFQRIEIPPSDVEPAHGQIYQITLYYDDDNAESWKKHRAPKWMRRHGFCVSHYVSLDTAGRVTVLKQLLTKHHHIHYRAGQYAPSNRGANSATNGNHTRKVQFTSSIPVRVWDYPEFMRDWFREKHPDKDDAAMLRFYVRQFNLVASFANANEAGVRVSITAKDGVTASFALDMKRSAYFFKDRDTVLTPAGKKARIFHVRRPHMAHHKDGSEHPRKMCFPGLKRFPWAGYDVHITVPGLHHMPLMELMPPVIDRDAALALGKGGMTTKAFGKDLHDYLDRASR